MVPSLQDIVATLESVQPVLYLACVSITILIYDYILTLPREISLIWHARWTLFKALFLLTRYMPFVDLALRLWLRTTQQDLDPGTCLLNFQVSTCSFYVGTAIAQIVLSMRTWAAWNMDPRLTIGLPIFFVICWGPIVGITVVFFESAKFMFLATPTFSACFTVQASRIVSVSWSLLLIYDAGISILMLIEGIRYHKTCGSSKLFNMVFRNSLMYYLLLFATSLGNVLVVAMAPPMMRTLLFLADRFLHSIIACRVVLDIRGSQEQEATYSGFADNLDLALGLQVEDPLQWPNAPAVTDVIVIGRFTA